MLFRIASVLFLVPCIVSVFASQPTIKTVTSADGTRIYADAIGQPTQQSIVFVHGFALSGAVFDRFITHEKLRDNFYLVRYDSRGHGRSDKPTVADAYTSVRYAEDFTAVAEAFQLKKPLFVGWSLGAAIIADIVTNIDPLPILGAVSLDGSPVLGPDILPQVVTPAIGAIIPLMLQDTNVTASLDARAQFVNSFFENPENVSFGLKMEYLGQTVLQPPNVALLATQRPQNSSKLFAAGDTGTLQLQLLFGDSDAAVLLDPIVNLLKPHFHNLAIDVVPGGHAVYEDNPDGTIDALVKFIQQISPKA